MGERSARGCALQAGAVGSSSAGSRCSASSAQPAALKRATCCFEAKDAMSAAVPQTRVL